MHVFLCETVDKLSDLSTGMCEEEKIEGEKKTKKKKKKTKGSAGIRTRIIGFKVQGDSHYTTEPLTHPRRDLNPQSQDS